jgi:enoyl-CoA hydratase
VSGDASTPRKVLTELRGEVALLTLNAPEKRNALDLEMVGEMHRALDGLRGQEALAAVVITGAGEQAFAAGADITELRERKAAQALAAINSALFEKVECFPLPVIAAVRGWALGGGCELAIACDLRVCGRGAKFGQPEVKLGILPAAGATYRLPRLIGLGRSRELIYTGRTVDAEEALRIGLVNRVVDDAQVVGAACELAAEIGRNGRLAVRLAKAAINALDRPGQAAAQALESASQAILFDSDDKHRRMSEFLDQSKRK